MKNKFNQAWADFKAFVRRQASKVAAVATVAAVSVSTARADASGIVEDAGDLYSAIYVVVWGAVAAGVMISIIRFIKKR